MWKLFFNLIIFLMVFNSCSRPAKKLEVTFDFPIEGPKTVRIFNVSSGKEVVQDSLVGDTYMLDSLKIGVYLLSLNWERAYISVDEFRKLRPNTVDKSNVYSIQKMIFVDPNEYIKLVISANNYESQEALEQAILSKKDYFSVSTDILAGTHAKLYQDYDSLVNQGKTEFFEKRDSLWKEMYRHNDTGDLDASRRVNIEIKSLWDSSLYPKYLKKEIAFLKEKRESIVTPFILFDRIYSKETLLAYRSVLDELPDEFKKIKFVQDLYRYDKF